MNTEHATAPLADGLTAAPSGAISGAPEGAISGTLSGTTPIADLLLTQEEAPAAGLRQSLRQHRTTLLDYCTLALQPSLSDSDQDRMAEILAQAIDEPLLSFWIEEADCWVSEHLQIFSEELLQQQQAKLKRMIGQTWVDTLWSDLQHRTKALQAYLKRVGVYSGAIDGIMGPTTQHAVESLKTAYPDELPLGYL